MVQSVEGKKQIAPESAKTQKAREKLLKQWEEQDRLITKKALAEAVDKIYKWIASNASNRITVKKDIRLFDQNQNGAVLSRKVQLIAQKLRVDEFDSKKIVSLH